MKEISIGIDSLGRVKKKGKGLGQQYENNVTKYAITLDSSLVNPTYFYYIIVVPPTSTGKKMYAVPMLTENFEYIISSAITQYVGTWKFCMLIMHKELSGGDTIPVEGVVKITDEWEDEVEKGIIDNVQLEDQIADINLKIAYEELLLVKQEVESAAEYATFQATYAKNVADELLADKENGTFNGASGPKGEPGKDGVSPTAKVEQKVGGAILVVSDANGITTAQVNDGLTPYIGANGNWWIGDKDTGIRPDSDYVLPPAGKNYLGGVIVGDNLDVTKEGRVSVVDTPKYNDESVLSGTEIEIDSVLAIESNLNISGNSKQELHTGKNKFDINAPIAFIRGATAEVVNNSIKIINIDGDYPDPYAIYFIPNSEKLLGKTVTLSATMQPSGDNLPLIYFAQFTDITKDMYGLIDVGFLEQGQSSLTVTLPNEFGTQNGVKMSHFGLMIHEGQGGTSTLGDYVIYENIQLEEGSTATEYEPYSLSVSPDFPSEIRSVKSKSDNLLAYPYDTPKENATVEMVGITVKDNGDGTVTINGTTTGDAWLMFHKESEPLTLSAGTYTISGFEELSNAGNHPWALNINGFGFYNDFVNKKTFTLTEETSSQVTLKLKSGFTFNNITIKPMLNKGTESYPYQPYGYVPVEVKVEGKNLALWEVGTFNQNTGADLTSTTRAKAEFSIIAGEEYVINIPYARFRNLVILNDAGILIGNYQDCTINRANDYFSFIPKFSGIAKIVISNTDSNTNIDINQYNGVVQIERGSVPTPYEPYKTKTISLPLGDIELRSTLDTRDTFERVDGVWNKKNNAGNTIVNGQNQNASLISSYCTENHNAFTITGIKPVWNKPACKGYSNKFKVITSSSDINGKDEPNLYFGNVSKAEIWVKVSKEVAPTVTDFRTWLSNNPIEIQYPLAEPTYTPITDQALISALDELEELILHKGYNHITATAVNGVKAQLDLTIPSTAFATNVVETESGQDLIVPVISSVGNVKVKIPAIEENQIKLNPITGLVKIKRLSVNGKNVANEENVENSETNAKEYTDNVINTLIEEKEVLWFKKGMILMWSGTIATIPTGWALCDGSNGTPDLRNRFIVGAGSSYSVGNTGGSASVTLTEAQIPSHTHTGTTSEVSGKISYATSTTKSGDSSTNTFVSAIGSDSGSRTATAEVHTHTFTTEAAGSGEAVEILPPYYALAYIMKL